MRNACGPMIYVRPTTLLKVSRGPWRTQVRVILVTERRAPRNDHVVFIAEPGRN